MQWYKLFGFNLAVVVIVTCLIAPKHAGSAPCCASSSAVPVLIAGEDEAQVNLGTSLAGVVAEVSEEGIPVFGSPDTSEWIQTGRLEGAVLLSDRLQAGVGLSLVKNRYTSGEITHSSSGMGDIRLNTGYEILPSWTYSNWKPQGFLFSVITLPTGRSRYESLSPTATDVTGNGFYSLSVGTLLLKRWASWDAFFVPEVHYSLPRTFQNGALKFQVQPGFGGSVGFGLGVSPGSGNFRFGVRMQPRFDQARAVSAMNFGVRGKGGIAYCDTGFDVAYLMSTQDTVTLSYTDQTFLGSAMNSNLSRILALNYQHRWER